MNKKILSLAVVAILSLGFAGCSSSSDATAYTEGASTTGGVDTSTKVEVERGKVYDASVTDSSTPVLTAFKRTGSNIYSFATPPTYPIKVNGGWIDVDGDGEKGTSDIALDVQMTSYSNVVTTITTYISDPSETVRQARIAQLMSDMNIASEANLLAVPSKADTNTIILANAIFKVMKENNTSDISSNFSDINSSFSTFKTTFNQSGSQAESQTPAGIAKWMESTTVEQLEGSGKLSYFTQDDVSTSTPTDPTPDVDTDSMITILSSHTSSYQISDLFGKTAYTLSIELDDNGSINEEYTSYEKFTIPSDITLASYNGINPDDKNYKISNGAWVEYDDEYVGTSTAVELINNGTMLKITETDGFTLMSIEEKNGNTWKIRVVTFGSSYKSTFVGTVKYEFEKTEGMLNASNIDTGYKSVEGSVITYINNASDALSSYYTSNTTYTSTDAEGHCPGEFLTNTNTVWQAGWKQYYISASDEICEERDYADDSSLAGSNNFSVRYTF